jgi:methylated-DNA-[protein]-cysteine S-methyltransferase
VIFHINTPVGNLYANYDNLRLTGLSFNRANLFDQSEIYVQCSPAELRTKINNYFSGQLNAISELKPIFEKKGFKTSVYKTLIDLPSGNTLTYGKLAGLCGNPKAARAVGVALKNNPLVLIIACHRVVGATTLGGYNAGIKIKKALLSFELNTCGKPFPWD